MAQVKYTIDLDRSRVARSFEKSEETLWNDEFHRMLKLILRHQDLLDDSDGRRAPHLSIAVFGPSGSGKSSFLETFSYLVNNHGLDGQNNNQSKSTGLLKRVNCRALPLINPSTFAEGAHFLYGFLATALEESEGKKEDKHRDEEVAALSQVSRAFNRASKYLKVIDQPLSLDDYDPLGSSLERLERHTSGLRLKQHLDTLVEALADRLTRRVDASYRNGLIILPVDDADLRREWLVPTLQAYRTYLLHPRLVPIFTFTDRMAEELLREHFRVNLSHDGQIEQTYGEAGRLEIDRQMSLQYLANCFPVRNRIRLGPAPARVQQAEYWVRRMDKDHKHVKENGSFLRLLITSSYLLFGYPDRDSAHDAKSALRPSTLRRQLQVADAMLDADVDVFFGKHFAAIDSVDKQTKNMGKNKLSWGQHFRRAGWSLLNTHRDVLREYGLHLEDLFSWTPFHLRRIALDTLLAQDSEKRRALLQRWLSRTDERRGQVLSLLATLVFSPHLPGHEPTGDDKQVVLEQPTEGKGDRYRKIPARKVLVWFLNLMIGFYQPLLLSRNRPGTDDENDHPQLTGMPEVSRRLSGVGWDLRYGPVNAIKAADSNLEMASNGILFLNPKEYIAQLKGKFGDPHKTREEGQIGEAPDDRSPLLLRLWSCYGYSQGRFWAAISFWRGLGLIGRLLELEKEVGDFRAAKTAMVHAEETLAKRTAAKSGGADEANQQEQEKIAKKIKESAEEKEEDCRKILSGAITGLLKTHSLTGLVPRSYLGLEDKASGEEANNMGLAFPKWESSELEGSRERLADGLVKWLLEVYDLHVEMMPHPEEERNAYKWKHCSMRRLHGETVVGDLVPRMNKAYLEKQEAAQGTENRWTAGVALRSWIGEFGNYWTCDRDGDCTTEGTGRFADQVRQIVDTCPLLPKEGEKDNAFLSVLDDISRVEWEEFSALSVDRPTRNAQD